MLPAPRIVQPRLRRFRYLPTHPSSVHLSTYLPPYLYTCIGPNCIRLEPSSGFDSQGEHAEGRSESQPQRTVARVYTTRAVLKGEELCTGYIQPAETATIRRRQRLAAHYLFDCMCATCTAYLRANHGRSWRFDEERIEDELENLETQYRQYHSYTSSHKTSGSMKVRALLAAAVDALARARSRLSEGNNASTTANTTRHHHHDTKFSYVADLVLRAQRLVTNISIAYSRMDTIFDDVKGETEEHHDDDGDAEVAKIMLSRVLTALQHARTLREQQIAALGPAHPDIAATAEAIVELIQRARMVAASIAPVSTVTAAIAATAATATAATLLPPDLDSLESTMRKEAHNVAALYEYDDHDKCVQ